MFTLFKNQNKKVSVLSNSLNNYSLSFNKYTPYTPNENKNLSLPLSNIPTKSFAYGKWNLYKFRRDTGSYYLKDFTKHTGSKKWIESKIQEQKSKLKTQKLSSLLETKDIKKLKQLNPILAPNKRQFNKSLRKGAMGKIAQNELKDFDELNQRLFHVDHTAQVLENIRNDRENKIFNRKLHEVKEKKLALKLEGRKAENLIDNFHQKFLEGEENNIKYNLMHFIPEGRLVIGDELGKVNLANPNIAFQMNNNSVESNSITNNSTNISGYVEYQKNKKELANKRIESMLSNNKSNPALLKYLENNSESDRNLIDGPQINSIVSSLNKDASTISLENSDMSKSLENFFQPHFDITTKIEQYEMEVYNEYKKIDIYGRQGDTSLKRYQKGTGITKFGDLTLEENLNYIKHNIKNSKELFKMYKEIIHPDFTRVKNNRGMIKSSNLQDEENLRAQPIILSAILQKFALGYKKEEDLMILFSTFEYRDILKRIKANLGELNDKNLVDNFWSIGKLHGRNRNFQPAFFQHLLDEMLDEIIKRQEALCKNDNMILRVQQISFLCEALNYLKINEKYDDRVVVKKEDQLVNTLYENLIQLLDLLNNQKFTNSSVDNEIQTLPVSSLIQPFIFAKILNLFYNINWEFGKFNKLLYSSGKALKAYLYLNKAVLVDLLYKNDYVKLAKAFSWGVVKSRERENKISNSSNNKSNNNELVELLPTQTSPTELYQEILRDFSIVILTNIKSYAVSHCASLLYHYANAEIYDKTTHQMLQIQITNKLERMEDFKLSDILNYIYGLAKVNTHSTFPRFNYEPLSIIYPNLSEKVTSGKFFNLNKFKNRLFDKSNTLNVQDLSLICYFSALLGFNDIDFYLPILHNIIMVDKDTNFFKNRVAPMKLEDIGYVMQCFALLNYNDMSLIDHCIEKFASEIKKLEKVRNGDGDGDGHDIFEKGLNNNLNNFSISQVLSSCVNLSLRKYLSTERYWKEMINRLKKYIYHNFTSENPGQIISALWFFSYFEQMDEFMYNKLISECVAKLDDLGKFEKIVFNQVLIYNYLKNNLLHEDLTKDFVENLNSLSLEFEKTRGEVQKKISMKGKFQKFSFVERIKQVIELNEKELFSQGYGYELDYKIGNSYIAPVYFPKSKLCILFYDHSERMKDKNINGYNSVKEDIFYLLGYKIERIYAIECENILDNDNELYNLVIKKIR